MNESRGNRKLRLFDNLESHERSEESHRVQMRSLACLRMRAFHNYSMLSNYLKSQNMGDEKIKIVYIICNFAFGGAERFLLDLIKHLNLERYEVHILTIMGGGPLEKEFKDLNVRIQIFKKKTKLGLGILWQIYCYLKREKPQIVHTHLFAGDTWGRIAAILAGAPIIISTEHNTNLDEGLLKRLIKRILSYKTDKIVAVSNAVSDYSIRVDKKKKKKILVIPNGICFEKFVPKAKKFEHIPILGVIGRLEIQKGHAYLFQALNLVKDIPWKLWLVGEGSLRKKLEKQVKELSLEERVSFLGAQYNVLEILQTIDIFILPSLWEGLGIAVLEAAAMAKPIIASKVGGIPEIIEDKKTGLLVEPKKVTDLGEAIRWMLGHENEANEMGRCARKIVLEKFDIEKMVKEYEKLYERLMETNINL